MSVISLIIYLILEIFYRAALITATILLIDLAHNGKIDLPHKRATWKMRDPLSKFFMKIAEKLESAHKQRKRAWDYRVRREVKK